MVAVTRLHHASVPVPPDGADQVRRFYGGALGLEEIPVPTSLKGQALVWFRAGPNGDEIHCFPEADSGPNCPAQHLCLQVDDIAAMRQRLGEHHIAVQEATKIPNRPRMFVRDPFGNLIEFTQINGDYD